ncbi:MAG TPA: hypothetical protein VIS94_04615 [Desulfomonilia bacterium]
MSRTGQKFISIYMKTAVTLFARNDLSDSSYGKELKTSFRQG